MLLSRTSEYRLKSEEERLHQTPTLLPDMDDGMAVAFVVILLHSSASSPECGFAVWNCDARGDESQQDSGEGGRQGDGAHGKLMSL